MGPNSALTLSQHQVIGFPCGFCLDLFAECRGDFLPLLQVLQVPEPLRVPSTLCGGLPAEEHIHAGVIN